MKVPPAFGAFDSKTGNRGALIEWFYDRNQEFGEDRFVHGVDYLKRIIPNFDFKQGTQHNLKSVMTLLRTMHRLRGLSSPSRFWGRTFAFDALIGNTDRHQENWGLLWSNNRGSRKASFAPAFDNGTSLGHEQTDGALARFKDQAYLDRYISRGRHHMRWSLGEDRISHLEMIRRVHERHPASRSAIRAVAKIPILDIVNSISSSLKLAETIDFSPERSIFVLDLTRRRHYHLQEFIG